jgi:hypothetical protein
MKMSTPSLACGDHFPLDFGSTASQIVAGHYLPPASALAAAASFSQLSVPRQTGTSPPLFRAGRVTPAQAERLARLLGRRRLTVQLSSTLP